MKKLLTLVLAFVLALCAFAGCKKKESGEVKLEIKTNNVTDATIARILENL